MNTNQTEAEKLIIVIMDSWLSIIYDTLWKRRNLKNVRNPNQPRPQGPPPNNDNQRKRKQPRREPFPQLNERINQQIIKEIEPTNQWLHQLPVLHIPPPRKKRKQDQPNLESKKRRR